MRKTLIGVRHGGERAALPRAPMGYPHIAGGTPSMAALVGHEGPIAPSRDLPFGSVATANDKCGLCHRGIQGDYREMQITFSNTSGPAFRQLDLLSNLLHVNHRDHATSHIPKAGR